MRSSAAQPAGDLREARRIEACEGEVVEARGASRPWAMLGEGVEAVQIGFDPKARAVGIKPAAEGGRGVLKLRRQPNGRSRLIDAKRFFSHHELAVETARGLAVEQFGGGVVGFRLPEEETTAAETETPAKAAKPRRKAAAD